MRKRTAVVVAACGVVGLAVVCVLCFGVLSGGRTPPVSPAAGPSEGCRPPVEKGAPPTGAGQGEAGVVTAKGEGEAEIPGDEPRLASWEQRITRVTDELGLTADISDCKVIVDGEPLEGKKVLAALGDDLFVNEYRAHPPLGGSRTRLRYSGAVTAEASLVFRELLRRDPANPDAAMERAMAFAASLPKVDKVERASWEILVYYEPGFLRSGLVGKHFHTGADPSAPETRRREARRERGIVERFREILRAVDSGATLAIDSIKGYEIQR